MRTYTTTAKLWITIEADNQDNAQASSKQIIDEALYAYMQSSGRQTGNVSISKAKILWVKENTKE